MGVKLQKSAVGERDIRFFTLTCKLILTILPIALHVEDLSGIHFYIYFQIFILMY